MLLWADGFEAYGSTVSLLSQGVYAEVNNTTLSTDNPRTEQRCARIVAGNDGGLRRVFGRNCERSGVGHAFYLSDLPSNSRSVCLAQWRNNDNAALLTVIVSTTGQLIVKRGSMSAGTVLATSAPCVVAGSWLHFEGAAEIDPAAGSLEVRINGVTYINLAGANTGNGDNAQVLIGSPGLAVLGFPTFMKVDDLFAWDEQGAALNDFIGDKKAYTRFVSSDGLEQDWTPSVGSDGFAMLDNAPPQDGVEYVEATAGGTGGDRSTFGLADFPEEIVSITGVYVQTRLFKTDAGTANVSVGMISAATEEAGAEHPLSTSPTYYGDVFEVDPATGVSWTLSALNAAQLLLERTE